METGNFTCFQSYDTFPISPQDRQDREWQFRDGNRKFTAFLKKWCVLTEITELTWQQRHHCISLCFPIGKQISYKQGWQNVHKYLKVSKYQFLEFCHLKSYLLLNIKLMFLIENMKYPFFLMCWVRKANQHVENIHTHFNGHSRARISHNHQKWFPLFEATLVFVLGIFLCWKVVLFCSQKTMETSSTESHSSDWVLARFSLRLSHMARGQEPGDSITTSFAKQQPSVLCRDDPTWQWR